jgi:hypothetical protein
MPKKELAREGIGYLNKIDDKEKRINEFVRKF